MKVEIQQVSAVPQTFFHIIGPREQDTPQSFAQLKARSCTPQLSDEWQAIYHGNPQLMPAEPLQADTVISVPVVKRGV